MAETTKIEWCHHTFNAWRGCEKVSPGCAHCYAEAMSHTNPAVLGEWGPQGKRVIAAEAYWNQPHRWDRAAARAGQRRRVFCLSLGDIFEDRPELALPRKRLGALITDTPNLDWLLLTKRPESWRKATAEMWWRPDASYPLPPNVWVGVSVEDQERADERIPILGEIPAAVRFLSCEPLLGRLDLRHWLALVDWVILGGESGHKARPCHLDWMREVVRDCHDTATAVFVKQMGSQPWDADADHRDILLPLLLDDKKGGQPGEWPEDLRMRHFPMPQRRGSPYDHVR